MESSAVLYKELAVEGMDELLKVLSFVPDDKLTWTPTPTAKSAIRIGAHAALYSARFARMIQDRKLPQIDNLEERMARQKAAEVAITSRAEVELTFRKGTDEVIAALDSLTAEEIGAALESGFGWSMPMTRLMSMPGLHALNHSAQIDYLQTCWGDQKQYF